MSKVISRSERDSQTLENIRKLGIKQQPSQPANYSNVVVVKPWGYEFLVFENSDVAIWRLWIDRGHATSMHCHPQKKTSLIVLSGQALCNTFFNRNYLSSIDGVVIESGVFHSTQAMSKGGCDILEIESPPDKLDLVRLNDQYGRSGSGYEGLSAMKTTGLEQYGYFTLEDPRCGSRVTWESEKYSITMLAPAKGATLESVVRCTKEDLYCPCTGGLVDHMGNLVVGVGEVVDGTYLGLYEQGGFLPNTLLMHMTLR